MEHKESTSLLNKIRDGIQKSGFPLEMKIAKILKKKEWGYSIGSIYEDFQTGKEREVDLCADKIINGISVNLFIECKKSESKQLVLYAPTLGKVTQMISLWLKIFPTLRFIRNEKYSYKKVVSEFEKLKHFSNNFPLAKNLIVTKGNVVTEDNLPYYSSINGLIKKSIHSGSDGYLDTNFRCLFLYCLIFDGNIYLLSDSESDDFNLNEIQYGQLEYDYKFSILRDLFPNADDLLETAKKFGFKFLIEVMNPNRFEDYLIEIEEIVEKINVENLKGWGLSWPKV